MVDNTRDEDVTMGEDVITSDEDASINGDVASNEHGTSYDNAITITSDEDDSSTLDEDAKQLVR